MSIRSRNPGNRRRLVLAFDVGNTYSGISYSMLEKGQVPQIKGVTRFPAHELISGASKIPTIIYYDRAGKVRAVGAEATLEEVLEAAKDGNWVKAECFILHLCSNIGAGKNLTDRIPPLPQNKTVVDVFADFLRYMLKCAASYIRDTHANGDALWDSVEGDINFVLSHPNGWEGKERDQMRKAAVLAGLVPGSVLGHERLSFLTEGQAYLYKAIHSDNYDNDVLSAALERGEGIVIVDASGGTINVSSYRKGENPVVYEETASPQIHFQGSVFVSILAKKFLQVYLEGSPFIDDLDHIVRCFDRTTKHRFRNEAEPQYIKFGSLRDNDPQFNIRLGQLKLAGSDVAQFFEPSVDCIISAVLSQRNLTSQKITHVVLDGGFSMNDWLFNSVLKALNKVGMEVHRNRTRISDGAVQFFFDRFVKPGIVRKQHLTPAATTDIPTYRGNQCRLVLAFDIGSTNSGISYSVLEPGKVPQIKGVARFPAHELISGASKIPTIIYYDQAGNVRAVGAEATREGISEAAEDGKWVKAEWFKLHLRSKIGAGKHLTDLIPPLPLNKTVVEVFADFLHYMLECAASYIRDTHANGHALWDSVTGKGDIDFVLSHPNGWEGKEQTQMRKAAVLSGLIPDTVAGHARVSFVSEGEAGLHFAVLNGTLSSEIKNGEGIIVVDAGGGTIDVSSYTIGQSTGTNSYEENAPPQCHFQGSIFVTMNAKKFLQALLEQSDFINDLDHIVQCFDKTTKLRFKNPEEVQYINFGSTRDNDPRCNIRSGQLKLAGSDVIQFFELSVKCIISAVVNQRNSSQSKISHVVLVGGFAASDWLLNSISVPLKHLGLNLIRPKNHVNKAVSDGAISFYLDHFVRHGANVEPDRLDGKWPAQIVYDAIG